MLEKILSSARSSACAGVAHQQRTVQVSPPERRRPVHFHGQACQFGRIAARCECPSSKTAVAAAPSSGATSTFGAGGSSACVACNSFCARACANGAWRCRRWARRGNCSGWLRQILRPVDPPIAPGCACHYRQVHLHMGALRQSHRHGLVRSRMRSRTRSGQIHPPRPGPATGPSVRATSAQRSSIWQSGPGLQRSGWATGASSPHCPCTASPNHWPLANVKVYTFACYQHLARLGQRSGCMSAGNAS